MFSFFIRKNLMLENLFGKHLNKCIDEKTPSLLDKADSTLLYLNLTGIAMLLYDLSFVRREGEKKS